jgi:hypothetical protein
MPKKKKIFTWLMLTLLVASVVTPLSLWRMDTVKAYDPQSIGDFTYVKQITIDNTKVDAWLHDFPVYVYNSSNELKDTSNGGSIRPDGYDIAFFSSDNQTQFAHEIELYDGVNGVLHAWVNVTDISPSTDTIFYMYYGDEDASDNSNRPGVWDGHYKAVYHLDSNGTGPVNDSTANGNNFPIPTNPDNRTHEERTVAKVGGACQFFDGHDYLNSSNPFTLGTAVSEYSIHYWFRTNSTANYQGAHILIFNDTFAGADGYTLQLATVDDDYRYVHRTKSNGYQATGPAFSSTGTWYFGRVDCQSSTTSVQYLDKTYKAKFTSTTFRAWDQYNLSLGMLAYGAEATPYYQLTGYLDEVRFSDICRNDSYANATYENQADVEAFLTFGAQGDNPQADNPSVYTIVGLYQGQVTFEGTVGTTQWCNATGDTNETLEMNMSINITQNVSEIRIWVGDLNNSNAWINASNMSIQFSSDNSTWGTNTRAFTDGGSNVTINNSVWTTDNGCYGTNPFSDGPLNNTNTSIFARFKLNIPAETGAHIYYNAENWAIYIGGYD